MPSPAATTSSGNDQALILIVDDHAIARKGVVRILSNTPTLNSSALEAESMEEAELSLVQHPGIDLVILDLSLPGYEGCAALRRLLEFRPGIPVIVMSAHDEASVIQETLQLGACSYIPKGSPLKVVIAAIQLSLAGGSYLPASAFIGYGAKPSSLVAAEPSSVYSANTASMLERLSQRQKDVLELLLQGKSNQEIASAMHLSVGTIKHYVSTLLRLCGVQYRTQLISSLKNRESSQ